MAKKVQSTDRVMNTDPTRPNRHDPTPEQIRKEALAIRLENNERDGLKEEVDNANQSTKTRPN